MYLDNAATTPLLPEVKNEIIKNLDYFGNPSSIHEEGRYVKNKIDEARFNVAKFINGNEDNVIFTSSGSAANNLVIHGLNDKYMYFYTPTSHKSMRLACENKPFHCAVQMQNDGMIDKDWLYTRFKKVKHSKIVFCFEMTNSEIGISQDNDEIISLVKQFNGIVVADATAYIPHYQLSVNGKADFYTFSGHKIGALKGIGVVYYNSMEQLKPLIFGSQERGLFGGTENVIGIISLGKAVECWQKYNSSESVVATFIRNEIQENIEDCYEICGKSEFKNPFTMMFCFKNVKGEELLTLLNEDGYFVSTGSACNSGSLELSPALLSIGIPKEDIPCCIRISIIGNESIDDIKLFIECLKIRVEQLRVF